MGVPTEDGQDKQLEEFLGVPTHLLVREKKWRLIDCRVSLPGESRWHTLLAVQSSFFSTWKHQQNHTGFVSVSEVKRSLLRSPRSLSTGKLLAVGGSTFMSLIVNWAFVMI